MKLIVIIVGVILSLPVLADAPLSARKGAAKEAARELLKGCSGADDVKQCLVDRGAVCDSLTEKSGDDFECVTQITISFTKTSVRPRPPETIDKFDVTYRIYMTKKGWKARTKEVVLVDS